MFPDEDPPLSESLSEGSLRIALDLSALSPGLTGLYGLGRHWAEPGGVFGLWASPRGGLVLRHRSGQTALSWEGPAEFVAPGDRLRFCLQVWTGMRRVLLTAENGTTGSICEARFDSGAALPLTHPWSDLPEAPRVEVARLPLGARGVNGMAEGTLIPTPDGMRRLEELQAGALIRAQDGPVVVTDRWVEPLTETQRQEAICLRAPYFGLQRTMVVLPGTRLPFSSAEVQHVTGQPEVLIAARDLVVGRAAHPDWEGRGRMHALSVARSCDLAFGSCLISLQGSFEPDKTGALLPHPGHRPWATRAESRAILESWAHRKGIAYGQMRGVAS